MILIISASMPAVLYSALRYFFVRIKMFPRSRKLHAVMSLAVLLMTNVISVALASLNIKEDLFTYLSEGDIKYETYTLISCVIAALMLLWEFAFGKDRRGRSRYFLVNEKHPIRSYLLRYTALFSLGSVLVFGCFIINGKTFVWQEDGWEQHFKALCYFSEYSRSVIDTLINEHRLSLPTFSMSFGLGSDIFTTLQYYVIGDPFNAFAFLFQSKSMLFYYHFMILARLYCTGLSFSAFAFYRKKSQTSVLAGALVYTFSSYAIFSAVRHPYFMLPCIFFPLMILGIDKIINEKKPLLFTVIVAVSAMSNFYFFYMLVVLAVVYVIIVTLIPWQKDNLHEKLNDIMLISVYSIIGVLISAVLLLPIVLYYFACGRNGHHAPVDLMYNISYLESIFNDFITSNSPGSWSLPGTSAVTLIASFLLFVGKQHDKKRSKAALLISVIALFIPWVGYMMNGFGYTSNRWTWVIGFTMAFILTDQWENFKDLSKNEIKRLGICTAVYGIICVISYYNVSKLYFMSMIIVVSALFILTYGSLNGSSKNILHRQKVDKAIMMLIFAGIFVNSFYRYSAWELNYLNEFKESSTFWEEFSENETDALLEAVDTDEFYRYSGTSDPYNYTVISGESSSKCFWSLINKNINDYYMKNLITTPNLQRLDGMNCRTYLETLSSSKYFIIRNKGDAKKLPYGYEYVETNSEDYRVYKNKNALPLGYTYKKSITESDAETLTALEKSEAMMQSVILENNVLDNSDIDLLCFDELSVDYEISCESNDITLSENAFITTSENKSFTITFDGIENSETYLVIKNLGFHGTLEYDLYNDDEGIDPQNKYGSEEWDKLNTQRRNKLRMDKFRHGEPDIFSIKVKATDEKGSDVGYNFTHRTPKQIYYYGKDDYVLNLYYSETPKKSVTLTLPKRGIYTFDDIEVICQPMDNFDEQAATLMEDVPENIDLHENSAFATNCITCDISTDEDKYLLLTVPYSDSWTAYVDDEEAELLKANYTYMALKLNKGDHRIKLVYHTKGLKEGAIISCIGIILLAAALSIRRVKNKKIAK